MFTNYATKGTSTIVLGAIGLLAPSTAYAQTPQAQQASAKVAISAGKTLLEGTGTGVWIHPTGPTGSFHGALYDSSGNLRFLMEGGLTKAPGFESMQGPQFGYMDGNLYEASRFGALELVARVEGQWERAPNENGRFLAEILEAIDIVNPASLGLIEGEFRFRPASDGKVAIADQSLAASPSAAFVFEDAGSNEAWGDNATVDDEDDLAEERVRAIAAVQLYDDSANIVRTRRLRAQRVATKLRTRSRQSTRSATDLDDKAEEQSRFRARRLRGHRAASERSRVRPGILATGTDQLAQPEPSATDNPRVADQPPVDRLVGVIRMRWTLSVPLN